MPSSYKEICEEYNDTTFYFYKKKKDDKIWWLDVIDVNVSLFSFDKKEIFSLFGDYPHNLTPEQKQIFDAENPYWKKFFEDRQ